jgi:hypothetical protein
MHSGVSELEGVNLVRESICAPNVGAKNHDVNHYLQCRVFKAISSGCLAVTDNPAFKILLDEAHLFEADWQSTFMKINKMSSSERIATILKQQASIKNYTYLDHWMNISFALCLNYPDKFNNSELILDSMRLEINC